MPVTHVRAITSTNSFTARVHLASARGPPWRNARLASPWRDGGVTITASPWAHCAPRRAASWRRAADAPAPSCDGAAWTTLPHGAAGLLSSHPVANGLTGAAVGYAATLLVAAATYLWLLYVAPYRRLRSLVSPSLTNARNWYQNPCA